MFGGASSDALESASWVPCGPSVLLKEETPLELEYKWGDSYIQRYECLKTYPFTREDKNQVVEIASFIIETRVNLGGRYDKNKAQTNHLNTSPTNYNLINPVYSQIDNFFNYRILNKDAYDINNFPSQITWSLNKSAGADIDTWTNITLASTYDVEGSRGEISALKAWKDKLYCFQENGISQILFNSRVQINTSDGIPIEIGNSNKLDGNRYISDNFGCKDKNLIIGCNSGIYFIDNNTGHLMHLSEGFQDISGIKSMNSWFNKDNEVLRLLYDNKYSDLYVITEKEALCFSEILGQFVSTFDYPDVNLLESYNGRIFTLKGSTLYEMFSGDYNYFFTEYKPWKFTFISNGISSGSASMSKIFSNIEYRMDILSNDDNNLNLEYLRIENSYQDTDIVPLHRLAKPQLTGSYHNKDANLQKKFRTWRIQIPRNKNSMDRIMDHWCKITLGNSGVANQKAVLYDLNVKHYV